MQGKRGGGAPGTRAGGEGQGGGAVEGCRGCSKTESIGAGGIKEEDEGGTRDRSGWRSPVGIFYSFSCLHY